MKPLTKKERIILERVLRPLVESDYFNDLEFSGEIKDASEANALLLSAYTKIDSI